MLQRARSEGCVSINRESFMSDSFVAAVQGPYSALANTLCLGAILRNDEVVDNLGVNIALKSMNRHGLIAGATGTGKTKTIQMLSEQLSSLGVPSLLMDIKGDLSGLALPGAPSDILIQRQKSLNLDYQPRAYPVELLAMGQQSGVKVRVTLTELGPLLFSKMLDLNETQTSILSILFQYAKEHDLLLLDLSDMKQLLSYAQQEGKATIEANYGGLASASLKSILRAIIELESEGGEALFGEPSFDVRDLLQVDAEGFGVISILRLINLQDKPKLFSTFMLGLLTAVYNTFPEIGDPEKPKLVIFMDEAHLIFNDASKALLNQLENMVKLIRSKGVGLVFCTQSPDDVPAGILSQLGLKIQHALRAFTAKDRKAIKLAAENFPVTSFYDTVSLLTSLGIGKALISALDANGQPTPLIAAMIRAPQSRMGALSDAEITQVVSQSHLVRKYETKLEHASALEKLKERRQQSASIPQKGSIPSGVKEVSAFETLSKNTLFRQAIRSIVRELTRAVLSALGIKKSGKK